MKAIIGSFRYDTDSATLIGKASYGNAGDFGEWDAGLYRTQIGNLFLAGRGGPLTRFAQAAEGGGKRSGSRIFPMTLVEALAWAEDNLPIETVEEHFSGVITDA